MKKFLMSGLMATAMFMGVDAQAASVSMTFQTIDGGPVFEHGTKIADQYNTEEYGFAQISAKSRRVKDSDTRNFAGLYDSSIRSGGDPDLEPFNRNGDYLGFINTADDTDQFAVQAPDRLKVGNVLIIQEATEMATRRDGRYKRPDDEARGGIIDIVFGANVTLEGFDYFDIDNGSPQDEYLSVSFFDVLLDDWKSLVLDDNGGTQGDRRNGDDTGRRYASLTNPLISALRFDLKSSGAIDNITYSIDSTGVDISPVPLPGGVWLFGSVVLGAGLISRHNKKKRAQGTVSA